MASVVKERVCYIDENVKWLSNERVSYFPLEMLGWMSGVQGTNEKEVMLPFDLDVPGSIYY